MEKRPFTIRRRDRSPRSSTLSAADGLFARFSCGGELMAILGWVGRHDPRLTLFRPTKVRPLVQVRAGGGARSSGTAASCRSSRPSRAIFAVAADWSSRSITPAPPPRCVQPSGPRAGSTRTFGFLFGVARRGGHPVVAVGSSYYPDGAEAAQDIAHDQNGQPSGRRGRRSSRGPAAAAGHPRAALGPWDYDAIRTKLVRPLRVTPAGAPWLPAFALADVDRNRGRAPPGRCHDGTASEQEDCRDAVSSPRPASARWRSYFRKPRLQLAGALPLWFDPTRSAMW